MSELTPRESDLVLGGKNPPPTNAAILGGLAGVKQRLKSESIAERLWALNNSIQYGSSAIYLALHSLTDDSRKVRRLAKKILRNRLGEAGKEEFLDRATMSYFATLNDWQQEIYNPELGMIDSENTAYIVEVIISSISTTELSFESKEIDSLISDFKIDKLKGLILRIIMRTHGNNSLHHQRMFDFVIGCLQKISFVCPKLELLWVGEFNSYRNDCVGNFFEDYFRSYRYKKCMYNFKPSCRFYVCEVRQIMSLFSELESLYIYGNFGDKSHSKNETLEHSSSNLTYEKIKTLVIDGWGVEHQLLPVSELNMPNLEYFQAWISCEYPHSNIRLEQLIPILSGSAMPNLKYLGLCGWDDWNYLIRDIFNYPIMKQLAVLDLHMDAIGGGSSADIEYIINCLKGAINLKMLDLSNNCLSDEEVLKLQQLPFVVKSSNQFTGRDERISSLQSIPF